MTILNEISVVELPDAELVAASLGGNRDAFGQIISRYQSLICSLAYSATGSLGQSEDLAQETFITAWTRLRHLRERHKLRAWLCGIARFRIGKALRREGREPLRAAESPEELDRLSTPEPLPSDQLISDEEKAILWRSLERIPKTYRETLVLFYREHQSVENVAAALDLSEDAVKQRLSRGRKLLQEQVAAFVEGALEQTRPGKTFTIGVLAALPLLAISAKAATVTAAASKGGSTAKAATGAGMLSAFLTGGGVLLFSLLGVFGFFGRWLGRKMGRISQQSPLGRKRLIQFWRTLAIGFGAFVLPPMLISHSMIHTHPWIFRAETWSISAFYWVVIAALAIWIWQRRGDRRLGETATTKPAPATSRSYYTWVALGMIGPSYIVGILLFAIFFSNWPLSMKPIPETEARQIISAHRGAEFTIYQYLDGSKRLAIILPEECRYPRETPLTDSVLATLNENGTKYSTLIENEDFHNGGVQGWLVMLSTFIVVAGTALLLRRPGTKKFYQQEFTTPRAERREKNIFLTCAALGMLALSLLLVLFTYSHAAPRISGTEAGKIISEHKNARLDVFQFDDGSKLLWITLSESRKSPTFITSADETTLARLAQNQHSYNTFIQGRDFGYRGPNEWESLSGSVVLGAGAIAVLWWTVKKNRKLSTVTPSCC